MILIFSIPTTFILGVAILAYALGEGVYGGFALAANAIIDKFPIAETVLFVVLLGVCIFYGIKSKKLLNSIALLLSWSKSIFFIFLGMQAFLESILAAGGIIMTILVIPIVFLVTILLPGFEMYTTAKAWGYAKEDYSLSPVFKQAGIVYGIIAILVVLSLL